jgi:hypothetical protein
VIDFGEKSPLLRQDEYITRLKPADRDFGMSVLDMAIWDVWAAVEVRFTCPESDINNLYR